MYTTSGTGTRFFSSYQNEFNDPKETINTNCTIVKSVVLGHISRRMALTFGFNMVK